jgi:hypothetical protein
MSSFLQHLKSSSVILIYHVRHIFIHFVFSFSSHIFILRKLPCLGLKIVTRMPLTIVASDVIPPDWNQETKAAAVDDSNVCSNPSRMQSWVVAKTNRKCITTRQMALMCCEDLSPSEVVQKCGFVKFLLKSIVIMHGDEKPDPTIDVSRLYGHRHFLAIYMVSPRNDFCRFLSPTLL